MTCTLKLPDACFRSAGVARIAAWCGANLADIAWQRNWPFLQSSGRPPVSAVSDWIPPLLDQFDVPLDPLLLVLSLALLVLLPLAVRFPRHLSGRRGGPLGLRDL